MKLQNGGALLTKSHKEKNLAVIVQDNLSPDKHINIVVGYAYSLLKNIRTAFVYMDEDILKKLTVTMIYPKHEHAVVVWSLYKMKGIR